MKIKIEILPIHDIGKDKLRDNSGTEEKHLTLCRNCKRIMFYSFENVVFCSKECKEEFISKLEKFGI